MILRRKIFVDPDYYKGLNEAEEQWLREKRSNLAKKYNGVRKTKKDKDGRNKKNLEKLREEINQAERDIRGNTKEGPGKYVREAVNKSAAEKKKKELARQAELLAEKKKKDAIKSVGKKVLIGAGVVGGLGLGVALGSKAIKNKRDREKKDAVKRQVLGIND